MQRLEVSGAVRLIYRSLSVKGLTRVRSPDRPALSESRSLSHYLCSEGTFLSPPPTPSPTLHRRGKILVYDQAQNEAQFKTVTWHITTCKKSIKEQMDSVSICYRAGLQPSHQKKIEKSPLFLTNFTDLCHNYNPSPCTTLMNLIVMTSASNQP